jgi:murein L,D-transpeptidase YcbB/YkuD
MRKNRFNRLLAGTALAAAIAAPTMSPAAPDRIESVRPPPPSVNGQVIRHRAPQTQTPPNIIPVRRETAPVAAPAPQPVPPAPVVQQREPAPAAPPREVATESRASASLDAPLAAGDSQISAKLRESIAGKALTTQVDREPERKAMESFYAARGYAPVWIRDGRLTVSAKAVIGRIKNAAADALDPADYPVPDFASAAGADALADGDIKLTYAMLSYARHLAIGRIAPTRVSAEVDYGNHTPEPDEVLRKVTNAREADIALEGYNPPHQGFRALKAKLAELRGNSANASADEGRIAEGPAIQPGTKDARIPLLRERLKTSAPGDTKRVVRERGREVVKLVKADELVYDKALFNAIRHVQARADIKPTGIVDGRTLAAINGPKPSQLIDRVQANMERWRWLPRDLGRAYVMINVPDYTLKVVRENQLVWHTRIVAGKPQTPTPLLTAAMDNVIVNPSWYVPQSIIQNELLPLYASDPNIFDRMGLEVKKGPDGNINVVQPPGAANALGRIKFNFPNKFQVYLHDTPEKRLFAHEKRAFSHGCMRVENPTKFGEVMLSLAMSPGQAPSQQQLDRLFGQEEKIFKMTSRPMVHLTYQTAYVDDGGKLVLRDDIYGFDQRIKSILHTDERKIADVAPPQDPKRDLATLKSNQEILRRVERREAQNPFVFFEKLFR